MRAFIKKLSRQLPVVYSETNCFYSLAETMLNDFEISLKSLDPDTLSDFLSQAKELKCIPTSKRFISLVHKINVVCIKILQYAYKGQILEAAKLLDNLMYVPKYTDYKLMDSYCNYMSFDFEISKNLYRCVDFSKDTDPKDCNHVPFELRKFASKGRFNLLGYPCLYLSSSLKCAEKEIGNVNPEKIRWYGEFKAKNAQNKLPFLDFTLPSDESVANMRTYDMFCFLITYPIRLLCNCKSRVSDGSFCEEYLFSQLFMHVVLLNKKDKSPNFIGISYSSMHDRNCINYVIPALYDSIEPKINGHSPFIFDNFEQVSHQRIDEL